MARRVYRVEWERWLIVAILGVFTASLVFMADDGRQGPGSASRLIGYGLAAVAFVLVVRSFRLGIVSSGDEFEIRGLLHSQTFKAAEVESFTMVRGQG